MWYDQVPQSIRRHLSSLGSWPLPFVSVAVGVVCNLGSLCAATGVAFLFPGKNCDHSRTRDCITLWVGQQGAHQRCRNYAKMTPSLDLRRFNG